MVDKEGAGSFWDHLDELRNVLLKITLVAILCGIVAFLFKELLFTIVLAPKEESFITYRWIEKIGGVFSATPVEGFDVSLINTGLAQQFVIHMKTALCFGVLCASPYILYQLFRFVSPALYETERRYALQVVGNGYLMFIVGVMIGYFLIFPLTFRFLGTYQVSEEVVNMISLDSYMSTLVLICLAMGVVFELPVVCWLFARMGFLNSAFMKKYRKHSIVGVLIVAAVITPTSDVFTLLAVSLPMYLLYEASILLVSFTERKREREGIESDLMTT
ncbi:MAG: twin-arginine translocase subunit TatC [Muribaculaceae bacterium]|nr:twin-arginine translocase subunit TatC [Muribaculaceae bacterium]